MKKRSTIFLFPVIFVFSFVWGGEWNVFPQTLQQRLDNLLSDQFFESTLAAVDVYDLTAGKVVYQKNNKYLLHPASNMKILTSAAGLFFLGPEYNFETSLFYYGEIEDGVLNGDLYVVGGFDPEFSVNDLDLFVNAVREVNIKEINGNLYADVSRIDTLFWGEGWMWDDDPSTDAPYLSSLNINDNSVDVFVVGMEPDERAQVILNPYTRYFDIFNETITTQSGGENTYYITRDWVNRTNNIIVQGKVSIQNQISGDETPVSLNVIRPDKYFLTLFKEELEASGIKLKGVKDNFWLPYGAIHLATVSRPYTEVIKRLNKVSSNLNAEMVLYAMAEKYFGKPATAKNGARVIKNLISLAGLNPENYRLVDGSGLSHYNLVSAELILEILKYMYYEERELFKILIDSFSIAGVDGTLAKRMKDTRAENNVSAKTGTLSGVSALSGYLTANNGSRFAFSILMQNYAWSASTARAFQDAICNILTSYR
jgi:serine-type D-Ala-D-Ala carboxypeptidase/endopeptidase (penicillin-binding protein 4)